MGYVYLVESGGLFKIGLTERLARRMMTLSGGSPHPVALHSWLWSDDAPLVEVSLHVRFRRWRHHGEWFAFAPPFIPRVIRAMVWEAERWRLQFDHVDQRTRGYVMTKLVQSFRVSARG